MKVILYVEWGILMVYGTWHLADAARLPVWARVILMIVVGFIFTAVVWGGI